MKMAFIEDDFDYNPFYHALQEIFPTVFQEAQDKCCLICVPQTSSIQHQQFDQKFVEFHILRPSPFFKGQYVTTDLENKGTVYLDGQKLTTGDGFEERRSVKILAEETGYNKHSKQFRIILIDNPLTGVISSKVRNKHDEVDPYELKITFSQCKEFLLCFKECSQAMVTAGEKIRLFQKNYMVLKGFTDDAASKLQEISTELTQLFSSSLRLSLARDQRVIDNIGRALESYILSSVHTKVYHVVCEQLRDQDQQLLSQLQQLQQLNPQLLGVRPELCCPLPAAVIEIGSLEAHQTPLEKLLCIKTTLDLITEAVNSHLLTSKSYANDDDVPCLTSDDYIPLLVTTLIGAKTRHLASDIYYIEHFHWSTSTKDNLGYSFVSLQAAVQYLSSLSPDRLKAQAATKAQAKNVDQGSPLETSSAAEEANEVPEAKPEEPMANVPRSRRDKRMDRINRMLESTARELQQVQIDVGKQPARTRQSLPDETSSPGAITEALGPGPRVRRQPKSHLGDFLGSLKNDQLPSSYGKQS